MRDTDAAICVLGVPFDAYCSYRRGPALAPAHIREALRGGSMNLCAEDGADLASDPRWRDAGDLSLPENGPAAYALIEPGIAGLLAGGARVLSLGGDHSITYPILRAFSRHYPRPAILQIDAHPDLYDAYDGNRHSHACPFARIMEEGLATRLVQVGVRTHTPHTREQARRFDVETIAMKDWRPEALPLFDGPVYLSLDLDALDPACAPGVSHHEPGGLTTRDVIGIIQRLDGTLVGADIVELNPERDWMGMTAMTAAKLLKEIVARMLRA